MNKKGIFVPTLVILSILIFVYLNFQLNPEFSSDYRFKFIDVVGGEIGLQKQMFDSEQEIKYLVYEAVDVLFINGICEDWRICNPVERYLDEFYLIFDEIYEGRYDVRFDGLDFIASKDVEFSKKDFVVKTRHDFNYNVGFSEVILDELYNNCKSVKSCDSLGECKAICSEDEIYLNLEYPIDLEFVKSIKFKVSKRGELI